MVTLSGVRLGRSSVARLDRHLARAREGAPTYDHAGSTLYPERFPARAIRTFHLDVPVGAGGFDAAVEALRAWAPQRGLGARVHPPGARPEPGVTLLVVLPFGPVELIAPNRVVAVVDEPDRYGFAYGTLPGHPERGEECFLVERLATGFVRVTIRLDATPASALARALGPLATRIQRTTVQRYLDAVAERVSAPGS
jgi:uncharacterized protein (UPF0548 family)